MGAVEVKEAILIRRETGDQGTFGELICGDELTLHTAELPWRENEPYISCIPTGRYIVEWWGSKRFPKSYIIKEVENRSHILFHVGNWSGDVAMGFHSDVLGCVCPGMALGVLLGQKAVTSSGLAIDKMIECFGKEPWLLTIREAYFESYA